MLKTVKGKKISLSAIFTFFCALLKNIASRGERFKFNPERGSETERKKESKGEVVTRPSRVKKKNLRLHLI